MNYRKMTVRVALLWALLGVVMINNSSGAGKMPQIPDVTKDAPVQFEVKQKTSTLNISLVNETKHSLQTAFDYLIKAQQPNGSWKYDPAITALVLYSFVLQPSYNPSENSDKVINKGLDYLETFVKPDGGIYNKEYTHYTTATCLLALTEAGRSEHKTIIENAKKFLIESQSDETEGIDEKNPFYGGIGYGGDDRPDLSNTNLALDAIKAAEEYESTDRSIPPKDKPQTGEKKPLGSHWKKALIFITRTQNVKAVNDMPYATDDGGFIYETGHYKEERSHSYGSMTYAGLKSLLFARIDKEDIRVKKALAWIHANYTLEENPGFGTTSLYYYYMTATKCLAVMGGDILIDSAGVRHYWREDFIKKLISLQHEDGYWVNPDGRYWENIKDLTTAYSVIAMKFALKDTLTPQAAPEAAKKLQVK